MVKASAKDWADMVGFYRRLMDEYGWRQGPMLELVYWLAAGPYSQVLFPSTSHEALGLSTVPTYQERCQRPMVYIVYSEPSGFVLHWQRGQGDEVREEPVPSPESPEVFGRILGWLGVAEQRDAEQRNEMGSG
ncbi:MAG TPA: hypothetical protein VE988_26650 [Gemmataceae bacterium]|nr:hypothetical protein [Gemmataceae bacterium]